jgi:hypothetical protein
MSMGTETVRGAEHLPYQYHRDLFAEYQATGRAVRVYRTRRTNAVRVALDGHAATCVRDARIKAELVLYGASTGG